MLSKQVRAVLDNRRDASTLEKKALSLIGLANSAKLVATCLFLFMLLCFQSYTHGMLDLAFGPLSVVVICMVLLIPFSF